MLSSVRDDRGNCNDQQRTTSGGDGYLMHGVCSSLFPCGLGGKAPDANWHRPLAACMADFSLACSPVRVHILSTTLARL